MKIHQIVSENPFAAIKAGVNAFKAARAATPAVTKATTAVAKTAPKGKKAVDAAKTSSWWETEAAKIASKASGKEAALAAGALKSTVLATKADDIVGMMYKADMLKEATVYWYKSNQVENNPNLSPEEKKDAIRKLRGELILSVIAPKVGAWGISKLAYPLKIVPWITKISGSPNAAEVMKHLSKRGTEAALIAWFGVGDGKEWLRDTFGFLITGVGSAPELVGTIYEITKAVAQTASGNVPDSASGSNSGEEVDPNDPMSVMNKVADQLSGGGSGYVDPFKGTGRGGK